AFELGRDRLAGDGIGIVNLIREAGLVDSNKDGFRAIEQGGLTIDGDKVVDAKLHLREEDFPGGAILIRRGKKKYCRVVLV
ncbi:MAG: tyrosine--tRNA ligase, partial [Clostridiales Family XIII bacterium]|nr:tyrosine--tRNA ligase [Clostridiales Family XIII bacterium]